MKRICVLVAAFVGCLAATASVWLMLASFIYCLATSQLRAFSWPYTQWIDMAPYWRLNTIMTVAVVGSALLAAAFVGISIRLLWQAFHRPTRRIEAKDKPLYGDDHLATEGEMRSNNFMAK